MKYQISTVTEPGDCKKAVSTKADIDGIPWHWHNGRRGQAMKWSDLERVNEIHIQTLMIVSHLIFYKLSIWFEWELEERDEKSKEMFSKTLDPCTKMPRQNSTPCMLTQKLTKT